MVLFDSQNKNLLFKFFNYLIILAIVLFVGWSLLSSWNKINHFNFSLNYRYLSFSFIFLITAIVLAAGISGDIVKTLAPSLVLSRFKIFKIFVYSIPVKYLPGKVWAFAGRSYLGNQEGLGNKALVVSIVYEIFLSTIAGFLLSLSLLGIFFRNIFSGFYLITVAAIGTGLIVVHPKIFYRLINFVLIKFKKEPIHRNQFLDSKKIAKIILLYCAVATLIGIGFFFLISSVTEFLPNRMIGIIGAYTLASVAGTVAIFAPAGIGIKEGALILFLKIYFPLDMAVFLAFLGRFWNMSIEIILLVLTVIFTKIRTKI